MRFRIRKMMSTVRALAIPLLAVVVILALLAEVLNRLGLANDKITLSVATAAAGVLIGMILTRTNDLVRRAPKLAVAADHSDVRGVVTQTVLAPWPVDPDRIVANETHDAEQTTKHGNSIIDTVFRATAFSIGGMTQPTRKDHATAREKFAEQIAQHETNVREWLEEYEAASAARHETFEITLTLLNQNGAAHADAVTVTIALPDGAELVDPPDELRMPPETPRYSPPRPRSVTAGLFPGANRDRIRMPELAVFDRRVVPRDTAAWRDRGGGREWEITVGDLQPGRRVRLGDPLLVRVSGPGDHRLTWAVYSKSLRGPVHGAVTLKVAAADETRPAFGRIDGILRYPDAVIADDDANEHVLRRTAASPRTEDPPLAPLADEDAEDGSVLGRVRASHATWSWNALGLDPAGDCPPPTVIERVRTDDDHDPSRGDLAS